MRRRSFIRGCVRPSERNALSQTRAKRIDRAEYSALFLRHRFLDATTHLCKRLCPPVRLSVGPFVRETRIIFERRFYPFDPY